MKINFPNIGCLWWDLAPNAYPRQIYVRWRKYTICIFQDYFIWYPIIVRHRLGDWEIVWLWFDCNIGWSREA